MEPLILTPRKLSATFTLPTELMAAIEASELRRAQRRKRAMQKMAAELERMKVGVPVEELVTDGK